MKMEFEVLKTEENVSLNAFLRGKGVSVALIKKLKFLPDGFLVNGTKQNVDYKLKAVDIVSFETHDRADDIEKSTVIPQDIPLNILYMDEACMVVDKPYYMPIHPSMKHPQDTLANAFCGYWRGRGQDKIYRVLNRLDKNTSGLVIIALDAYSAKAINPTTQKIYTAIAHGKVQPNHGVIEAPIAREKDSIITRCVNEKGQYAKTEYEVIKQNNEYSLTQIKLHTGRTHQIRVHFSYIGHPLAGDDMYGGEKKDIFRHALHCSQVSFKTPYTQKNIVINSQLPQDMMSIVMKL